MNIKAAFLALPPQERLRTVRELQDLLNAPQPEALTPWYEINNGYGFVTIEPQVFPIMGLGPTTIADLEGLALGQTCRVSLRGDPLDIRRVR